MAIHEPFAGMAQQETLEAIQMLTSVLMNALGALSPDAFNRLRVSVEAGVVTVSSGTITTVTTVGSVTNIAQIGGIAANQMIPALQLGSEADLRAQIYIT
jgi:hypothetical protein